MHFTAQGWCHSLRKNEQWGHEETLSRKLGCGNVFQKGNVTSQKRQSRQHCQQW